MSGWIRVHQSWIWELNFKISRSSPSSIVLLNSMEGRCNQTVVVPKLHHRPIQQLQILRKFILRDMWLQCHCPRIFLRGYNAYHYDLSLNWSYFLFYPSASLINFLSMGPTGMEKSRREKLLMVKTKKCWAFAFRLHILEKYKLDFPWGFHLGGKCGTDKFLAN